VTLWSKLILSLAIFAQEDGGSTWQLSSSSLEAETSRTAHRHQSPPFFFFFFFFFFFGFS
jgi:hypothetical protein